MAFLERLGARVVIGTGEKIIRRLARDARMRRKGEKQGYKRGYAYGYAKARKELKK